MLEKTSCANTTHDMCPQRPIDIKLESFLYWEFQLHEREIQKCIRGDMETLFTRTRERDEKDGDCQMI